MTNVLVVTGSVRPNSANEKVVPEVVRTLTEKGAEVTIADLGEINLPFFDAPLPPSAPEFEPTNDAAKAWTKLVAEADGVLFVTPEYNHTLTPLQINAIDWIGEEWKEKPVALVGYGWTTGGAQAHDTAREALKVNLGAKVGETQANLHFMKDLNPDGTVADAEAVQTKLDATVTELLEAIG